MVASSVWESKVFQNKTNILRRQTKLEKAKSRLKYIV